MFAFLIIAQKLISIVMSLTKDSYVPSPFTLTLLDNFGTRRLLHRPNSNNLHPSVSHHRSEARLRPAFDKESLLEQLRKEKAKARQMNASSGYLKRQLSNSKHPHPPSAAIIPHRSIEASLKRELETVAGQVQAQAAEIAKLKASKKYNRYTELLTAKEVYQEELKAVTKRTGKNRYALRERKRMWREHCRREEDTDAIDRAVRVRLQEENKALVVQIEEEDGRIRANLERQASQLRERSRLVRDILQLQKITGKLFIMEREDEVENEEALLSPPPNLYSKKEETGSKPVQEAAESQKEDSQSEQQEQGQLSSGSEEQQESVPSIPAARRHNVSF